MTVGKDRKSGKNSFCGVFSKSNEFLRLLFTVVFATLVGIFIGSTSARYGFVAFLASSAVRIKAAPASPSSCSLPKLIYQNYTRGVELLPSRIVVPETDLYLRRLWGKPEEDLPFKPKYLVTFTVGLDQREIINASISKFSENWTIVLFHYDGHTSEWEEYDWAQPIVHISARKQTKWWFAKRFLHPDVVASFEYVFIWDEDLGLENFDAEAYIELVKKHGLEISQPGVEPNKKLTWKITKRLKNSEVHRMTIAGLCMFSRKPPCAGFVEIMAPVFSRNAWKCVWHLIQNDLVHGWGLDLALGRCVKPAHKKVGVVDAQWIDHKRLPSLGSQGKSIKGKAPWEGVLDRCSYESKLFQERMAKAEREVSWFE